MGYQVLARKYRPQRFSDVAGQDHVTRTLLNALSQNRLAHGYIFSGHRGIGKTTIARILAMALNCRSQIGSAERPTPEPCLHCEACREISSASSTEVGEQATHSFDFIEIDAASNRGIDDVRSIRNQATVQPARDKYKIFLLDEAHQITDAAFNAILKTLEEPPEWTIFMMATTEPENIPQTIRSRCQHFSFHAVKFEDILEQLRTIAAKENVAAEDTALALLAEAGDGSMRDALSIMDQAIASAPLVDGRPQLETAQIRDLMGSVPNAVFERLLEAVAEGQSATLMEQLNTLLSAGHSPSSLARQMARYLRNTLMAKIGGEQTQLLQISGDERARASRTAMLFTEEEITRNLQIVLKTFDELNYRQEQRFHLELGLLKLIHAQRLLPLEELLSGAAAAPRLAASAPRPSAPAAPAPRQSTPPAAPPAAKPTSKPDEEISPFGNMGGWKMSAEPKPMAISEAPAPTAIAEAPAPKMEIAAPPAPKAAPSAPPVPPTPVVAINAPVARSSFAAEAPAPEPLAPPAPKISLVEAGPQAASSPVPFPAPSAAPSVGTINLTEGALAVAASRDLLEIEDDEDEEQQSSTSTPGSKAWAETVAKALAAEGHTTASTLLGSGVWTVDGNTLRIEVAGMGQKMLALTVNAQAEKIIRMELQKLGAPSRFMVVPGAAGAAGKAANLAPVAGSVQERALSNPLVQRAREIFKAEIRSVVDLRTK
ncbi:DNA polymerase III subunit gamma/tau [Telmatobacter bradus]|uniref:DNA polymerase III subunit gamma/tau n=1 Tax=Telmatobacter bradus TaxID=474953 RepID=UPI003B427B1A